MGKKKTAALSKDAFFDVFRKQFMGLSFDDVLLVPNRSDIIPGQVNLKTKFSRNVEVNNPFISSPMDTVTGSEMAIEMGMLGSLGIIHRGLSPKEQASEVARVKYCFNKRVDKPKCVRPNATIKSVLDLIQEKKYKFRSFPVVNKNGKLVGLLTNNDFDFCLDTSLPVKKVMSRELITVKKGTSMKNAFYEMIKKRKKVLPLVSEGNILEGMYVFSDAKRIITRSAEHYNLDKNGRLKVGAAVGVLDDAYERAELLAAEGVDVFVIDTAHGETKNVLLTLKELKRMYPRIDVVAGNISTGNAAKWLVDAGVDGLRVGQGPGSICSTRVISGSGRAQIKAIDEVERAIRGSGVPVCADGGIKFSGDAVKALAAGAGTVMLGGMLSGTKEAPGEIILINGAPHKIYRGMGSIGAMEDSAAARDRYKQKGVKDEKLVPEGVEGATPYKGDVSIILIQLIGGVKSGMGYNGAGSIEELQINANFEYITPGVQKESHPHSLTVMKDAPNYKRM